MIVYTLTEYTLGEGEESKGIFSTRGGAMQAADKEIDAGAVPYKDWQTFEDGSARRDPESRGMGVYYVTPEEVQP